MTVLVRSRPALRSGRARLAGTLVLPAAGLVLVLAGAALPWLTVYAGLVAVPGFLLDGGPLTGIALAAAGLLVAARRVGGGRLLRPVAIAAAFLVALDAAYAAWRISAYVADPGPAAQLVQPTSGPGAAVMVAGALLLAAGAFTVRPVGRALERRDGWRLLLAGATLAAGWIHLLLVPEHLAVAGILGAGFAAAGIIQVALAAGILVRRSDVALLGVVAASGALLALYAWAVVVGLPIGGVTHDAQATAGAGLALFAGEPIDLAGAATAVSEAIGFAIAFWLLGRGEPPKERLPVDRLQPGL